MCDTHRHIGGKEPKRQADVPPMPTTATVEKKSAPRLSEGCGTAVEVIRTREVVTNVIIEVIDVTSKCVGSESATSQQGSGQRLGIVREKKFPAVPEESDEPAVVAAEPAQVVTQTRGAIAAVNTPAQLLPAHEESDTKVMPTILETAFESDMAGLSEEESFIIAGKICNYLARESNISMANITILPIEKIDRRQFTDMLVKIGQKIIVIWEKPKNLDTDDIMHIINDQLLTILAEMQEAKAQQQIPTAAIEEHPAITENAIAEQEGKRVEALAVEVSEVPPAAVEKDLVQPQQVAQSPSGPKKPLSPKKAKRQRQKEAKKRAEEQRVAKERAALARVIEQTARPEAVRNNVNEEEKAAAPITTAAIKQNTVAETPPPATKNVTPEKGGIFATARDAVRNFFSGKKKGKSAPEAPIAEATPVPEDPKTKAQPTAPQMTRAEEIRAKKMGKKKPIAPPNATAMQKTSVSASADEQPPVDPVAEKLAREIAQIRDSGKKMGKKKRRRH